MEIRMNSLIIARRLAGAAAFVVATTGFAFASEAPSGIVVMTKFQCKLSHGTLICGDTKKANNDGGGQGSGNNKGAGSQGERSCPPGYVVLKEKNKYGAFCEPKEGFPAPATAPPATLLLPSEQ
jgi:hypothetical protein